MRAKITLADGVVVEADGTALEIADLAMALRRPQVAESGGHDVQAAAGTDPIEGAESGEPSDVLDLDGEDDPDLTGEGDDHDEWGLGVDEGEDEGVDPGGASDEAGDVGAPSPVACRPTGPPLDLVVREVADQFRLLSDPTRLLILTRLTDRCYNVGEMCEALGGMSQPAVSHHLALLRVSGLVVPSREGKFNYYDLTEQGRTLTEVIGRLGTPGGSGAVALFRQASDTTRLQVLLTLSEGDRNVGELCSVLGGMSQPAVSHHLALLRHGGLVEARRDGKFSYYSLRGEGRELARLVVPMMAARSWVGPDEETFEAFDFSALSDDWMDDIPLEEGEAGSGDETSPGGAPPAHLLCRRVLLMVQELHRRGHERLRAAPDLSPSALHWGCSIIPASQVRRDNGAIVRDGGEVLARYDSAQGAGCFGWADAEQDSPAMLAGKFLERFPDVAAGGRGGDPDYARWYARMLRATDPDGLIYASAGWELPGDHLPALGCTADVKIPLPPPGEATFGG